MRDGERREGVKRRFTEEKDNKLPENLLGYQVLTGSFILPELMDKYANGNKCTN